MNILIAGASGFIGQKLVDALLPYNAITVLGREKKALEKVFPNSHINKIAWNELSRLNAKDFNSIINLSGLNIAASRWSESVKKELIDSRVKTTATLINWAMHCNAKPHFLCANAIGIYGAQNNGDEVAFDENSFIDFEHPSDFLSAIGVQWEQVLQPAINYGMKVTTMRFGVVLGKNGGMLKKLHPSFNFGLGSIIGDGRQILSWIHINDLVEAILFLLNNGLTGTFNLTSPYPISQSEFAKTLANTLHRPLLLKIPAFIVQLLFGEMGNCLLLKGQRVLPARLLEAGFEFCYPQLQEALRKEYNSY